VETLSPTYVLTVGLPGRSNALAIAGRLGLDPAIIEQARQWLGEDEVEVDTLLAQIYQEREDAQQALQQAQQALEHTRDLERRREREVRSLQRERHNILAQTRSEAEEALKTVRERLEGLQRDMTTVRVTREWMTQAQEQVHAAEEAIPEVPPAPQEPEVTLLDPGEALQAGDTVWVESLNAMGEVLLVPPDPSGEVEVQVGSFKLRRPFDDLRKASRQERRTAVQVPTPGPKPPMELDLRGWRAADVGPALERYLNDAYLSGIPFVRLIHGKGTGVLRQVVREVLEGHPLIRTFEGAPDRDGGEGVTVAHLISR